MYLASVNEGILKVFVLLDQLLAQIARVLEICVEGNMDVLARGQMGQIARGEQWLDHSSNGDTDRWSWAAADGECWMLRVRVRVKVRLCVRMWVKVKSTQHVTWLGLGAGDPLSSVFQLPT